MTRPTRYIVKMATGRRWTAIAVYAHSAYAATINALLAHPDFRMAAAKEDRT